MNIQIKHQQNILPLGAQIHGQLNNNAFTAYFSHMHWFAQFALRGNRSQVNKTNLRRGLPVWREGGMGQVAGVVVSSCSGMVQAQGQRGHAEGILCCGIGPKTAEVLFWYMTRRYCIRQLSRQTGHKRKRGGDNRGKPWLIWYVHCCPLFFTNK